LRSCSSSGRRRTHPPLVRLHLACFTSKAGLALLVHQPDTDTSSGRRRPPPVRLAGHLGLAVARRMAPKREAACTSSLRPHTYTSSLRPHTLLAIRGLTSRSPRGNKMCVCVCVCVCVCPNTTLCFLILLYVGPRTTLCVCSHTTSTYVNAYSHVCPHSIIFVLYLWSRILLYMCPDSPLCMCRHITMYVYMCPHTTYCMCVLYVYVSS
jgi:hypothetical protein